MCRLNIFLRFNRHEEKGKKGNHRICHNRQNTNNGRRTKKENCTIFCPFVSVEIRRRNVQSLEEREENK